MVPKQNLATSGVGTTPPARPFFELDGLAGTPPNLGGEFKRSCQFIHTFSRPGLHSVAAPRQFTGACIVELSSGGGLGYAPCLRQPFDFPAEIH